MWTHLRIPSFFTTISLKISLPWKRQEVRRYLFFREDSRSSSTPLCRDTFPRYNKGCPYSRRCWCCSPSPSIRWHRYTYSFPPGGSDMLLHFYKYWDKVGIHPHPSHRIVLQSIMLYRALFLLLCMLVFHYYIDISYLESLDFWSTIKFKAFDKVYII